jgi:drug/metabolite transporter (DMT)-like permease
LFPYIALGAGILSLGFSAIFVRWANAPGPVMGMYRMAIATAILAPVFALNLRRQPRLRKEFLIFPVLGGIATALDHAVWNTSVLYTTAANATLLGNTSPLWVALAAWLFFRERLIGVFWVGLGLALAGAASVMGYDFFIHPTFGWGDILASMSGIFYAGYFLATQRGRERLDTLSYIWLVDLTACISLLGASAALRMPLTGYPPHTYLAFLGAALVSQILGYLSVGYALGHLPASAVSPTMVLQPVVTALISIPLLGEMLHPVQWVGGAVVLVGIYLVHKSREIAARGTKTND